MRLPLPLTLFNILALFVLYVLQEYRDVRKDRPEARKTLQRVAKVQVGILGVAFVVTVFGAGFTFRRDRRAGLSWRDFIRGVPDRACFNKS